MANQAAAFVEIPLATLETLEADIDDRNVVTGIVNMTALFEAVVPTLSPHVKNACRFVAVTALWVDTGFSDIDALRRAFNTFGKIEVRSLSAQDLAYHLFALGMYCFLTERAVEARRYFHRADDTFVDELDGAPFYRNMIIYYLARCDTKLAQYPAALDQTIKSEVMAGKRGRVNLAAVIGYTRAWLLWQKGECPEAKELLEKCSTILKETDDFTAMAAIESIKGRMARRKGYNREAVMHAERSVCLLSGGAQNHPKYARYLLNVAASKRLLARELERELQTIEDYSLNENLVHQKAARILDAHRAMAEKSAPTEYLELARKPEVIRFLEYRVRLDEQVDLHKEYISRRNASREEVGRLRASALQHLVEAKSIHEVMANQSGLGLVSFYSGLLQLDTDQLVEAASSGEEAYEHALNSGNPVIMTRARILQCLAAKAAGDAELEEPSPGFFYSAAREYGEDAVRIAREKASHNRLLARSLLALGDVYATEFFNRVADAEDCCKRAEKLIGPTDKDYLFDAYRALSAKLYTRESLSGSVALIQGLIAQARAGERDRKQLVEEFENVIIVEVFKVECKVSRVADKLRMNEDHVRRTLLQKGLLRRPSTSSRVADRKIQTK